MQGLQRLLRESVARNRGRSWGTKEIELHFVTLERLGVMSQSWLSNPNYSGGSTGSKANHILPLNCFSDHNNIRVW
jgi:hypothetical protein